MLRVAIDGPGGTGKSTIAKIVAEKFDLEYIDTGAMYRSIALKTVRNNIDPSDEDAICKMLGNTIIDFSNNHTYLDGEDVSDLIRTNEISMQASRTSKYPCVRSKVDAVSKFIANSKNVVMEGRDICTFVIPEAEVKIFMTASPEVRAQRRFDQLVAAGKEADFDIIFKEINERDYQDIHRDYHPLKQAEDAIYLDSSELNIDENINAILNIIIKQTGIMPISTDSVDDQK